MGWILNSSNFESTFSIYYEEFDQKLQNYYVRMYVERIFLYHLQSPSTLIHTICVPSN